MPNEPLKQPRHPGYGEAIRCIFAKEVVDLLRDRRAVFFAFVLPLLLYPVLFFGASALQTTQQEELRERKLEIAMQGSYRSLLPHLGEDLSPLESPFTVRDVRSGQIALLVRLDPAESPGAPERVTLFYVTTSVTSQEARRRVIQALDAYRDELVAQSFRSEGVALEPATLLSVEKQNVASDARMSGATLGRLLPLVLILLLVTGGSFAALDLLAGEKERGTLETLYIHPIPTGCVVWGKFLVILATSLVSVILNLLGVALALWVGTVADLSLPVADGVSLSLPAPGVLVGTLLLTVPLAVLTSAMLLALSAYAGSFREAQTYLLPLTLLVLVAVLPALSPLAELESILILVPFCNVALAVREMLRGDATWWPCLAVFLVTSVYARFALTYVATLLRRENIVLRLESAPLGHEANLEGRERRGLFFAALMLLVVYFAGSSLQAWRIYLGLAVTLWGVVLIPALVYPYLTRQSAVQLLGLRATPLRNYLCVLVAAPAALLLVSAYARLQGTVLPLPPSLEEAFQELLGVDDLSPLLRLLLFAVSPAICEELLWRGAVQGDLQARRRTAFTVIVGGVLFGLFHFSIYRFVGTGLLGALLAYLRLRTGSVFPGMLLHGLNNALAVFLLARVPEGSGAWAWLHHPLTCVGAALLLALSLRALKGPSEPAAESA